jgi:hypothetical protein
MLGRPTVGGLRVQPDRRRRAGEGSPSRSGAWALSRTKRSVFPDLIVHDRSGLTGEHNILVVEAKKSRVGRHGVAYDLAKLRAYLRELHYHHAVYLELGTHPRWWWMGRDLRLRPVIDHAAGAAGKQGSAVVRRAR